MRAKHERVERGEHWGMVKRRGGRGGGWKEEEKREGDTYHLELGEDVGDAPVRVCACVQEDYDAFT